MISGSCFHPCRVLVAGPARPSPTEPPNGGSLRLHLGGREASRRPVTSPKPGMPSSFSLGYSLRVGTSATRRIVSTQSRGVRVGCRSWPQAQGDHRPREQGSAWHLILQRHRSVSMTQPDVDERIAAMRSRIAEQLLHIQRLNVLGRGTSDACEVLDLMLSALAQMKEVKKTIRALERAS